MRVEFFQVLEEERFGHIGELAMVDQVLHRLQPLAIERMEDAVIDPVEFQRRYIEQLTELLVERWRGLDPAPLQIQLGVTVHGEHVTLEQLDQARGRQVIAHIRETDPRRYSTVPRATGQQCGFGHAVALAGGQCITAAQGRGITAEGVGVVAHRFTHGVIQVHRLLDRLTTIAAMLFSELHHRRVVTIDEAAGAQVLVHENNLLEKP